MDWTLQNKVLKNILRIVLMILILVVTFQLWTGPMGELMLRFRVSPHPELLKNPPGKLWIHSPKPGTVFPPETTAPSVVWTDSTGSAKRWLILVESTDDQKLASAVTGRQEWKPGERLWTEMKKAGLGGDVRISVFGIKGFMIFSGSFTTIRTGF